MTGRFQFFFYGNRVAILIGSKIVSTIQTCIVITLYLLFENVKVQYIPLIEHYMMAKWTIFLAPLIKKLKFSVIQCKVIVEYLLRMQEMPSRSSLKNLQRSMPRPSWQVCTYNAYITHNKGNKRPPFPKFLDLPLTMQYTFGKPNVLRFFCRCVQV